MLMRPANLWDVWALYSWRNEPSVRRYFENTAKNNFITHLIWFVRFLRNNKAIMFFFESENNGRCGMTRLNESTVLPHYEISILVNPALHSKGIGKKILAMTMDVAPRFTENQGVLARVNKSNTASEKIFLQQGFRQISEDNFYYYLLFGPK
jgi:RimJ/RimL family protein N-acetyltransferase